MIALTDQAMAVLLLTLRLVPAFAFAEPFTLLRVPAIVRVMLSIALAAWLVGANPAATWQSDYRASGLAWAAVSELMLGVGLALSLQFAFAALLTVGRALDIQAGFGLAVLVDPTTKSQMPLIGTVFAYAAAAIFFASDGPADLLAIWAASVQAVPLGTGALGGDLPRLLGYLSSAFVIACGLGGAIMLALFLADLAIAFMSRTLPQMNVMLLGFQVKGLMVLALLPAAVALAGGLFLRLLRTALEAAPQLVMAR
ncbi:flagellar biosynthetic protein FliR [Sphingomonas sp.]|jgi:flagellar biosynthetic protein FliR|uniref:flagellar biosynthetic protein FliR n=1 Tax=Sphingomonas sp. TaxID=28214 RepID=UPI002E313900|nr:flagellar biosynthetic protein FliR [Sphingomonas sp.]HEX4695781.1 flagellar biosynthetic protein FliR [Sphingomonas sp.]